MASSAPLRPSSPCITPLPRPTSTLLRSSLVIPTLPAILAELVQNSLDAQSTRIDVHLALHGEDKELRVEDDGVGISKENLNKVGRRGISGNAGRSILSPRGEALSSVAALATIDVTTKPRLAGRLGAGGTVEAEVRSKVIKGSKVLYNGRSTRSIPGESGTNVVVKDIFHNVPVRRAQLETTSGLVLLNGCRKVVEELALVHPQVRWTVWDDRTAGSTVTEPRRVFFSPGYSNSLEVFREIYGSAGVEKVQNIRVSSEFAFPSTVAIGTKIGEVKKCTIRADGFISLYSSASRAHQHLYFKSRPLQRGELHLLVAQKFKASRFSALMHDLEPMSDPAARSGSRRSPRRAERLPIYVLNLSISVGDGVYVPGSGAGKVLGMEWENKARLFLGAVVDEFLKRHGFITNKTGQTDSPTERDVAPGQRVRSLARQDAVSTPHSVPPEPLDLPLTRALTPVRSSARLAGMGAQRPGSALRAEVSISTDHHTATRTPLARPQTPVLSNTPLTHITIDPVTGERRMVLGSSRADRPTGHLDVPSPVVAVGASRYNRDSISTDPPRRLSLSPAVRNVTMQAQPRGVKRKHQWIEDLMSEVGGDVLPVQASRASPMGYFGRDSLADKCNGQLEGEIGAGKDQCGHCSPYGAAHSETRRDPVLHSRMPAPDFAEINFPTTSLAQARVLGQVDLKYVACVLPTGTESNASRALVMIDQHAADERVSVEAILRELCEGFRDNTVPVTDLSKSAPRIILSQEETRILDEPLVLDLFRRWGIQLSLPSEDEREGPYVQVTIHGVPSVLLQRLGKQDAREMTRLVQLYSPILVESKGELFALLQQRQAHGREVDYERFVRWMPAEMLELVNSKACRNAIMFQDKLSLDQCTRLVSRLVETRQPFICAHGRPSLAPLVLLPGHIANGSRAITETTGAGEGRRLIDWASLVQQHQGRSSGDDVA